MKQDRIRRAIVSLLALIGLMMVAGCGGGTKDTSTPAPYRLTEPVEIPGMPGSIGGTIFTLAARDNDPAIIVDQATGATVTLTGTTTEGASISAQTSSTVRGGYHFAQVPAGTYSVSASITSPYAKKMQLTGMVDHVVVKGNIPTLMVNVLLGDGANKGTFTGTVTQNGHSVAGAVVSMEATSYATTYPPVNPSDPVDMNSVTISTTAGEDGSYSFSVPAGCDHYYLSAHSDSSMVTDSEKITQLSTTVPTVVNLTLQNATTPLFAKWVLDIVSTTLPEPTPQAANQALMTQLAVARALHAPQARIDRLLKLGTGTRSMRIIQGIVENDVYWKPLPGEPGETLDIGVQGYNVYRGTGPVGSFTLVGSARDLCQLYFFDNDPVLRDLQPRYYTMTCYAANRQESEPMQAILARPLVQISVQGPAPDSTVSRQTGRFSWSPVPGAQSYLVLKYTSEPTFNNVPVDYYPTHTGAETSEDMTNLTPGTYWYSVSAYNNPVPPYATASSFSKYYKVTVTN